MPYIKKEKRAEIIHNIYTMDDEFIENMKNGEFNYLITQICLLRNMNSYDEITDVIKVLRNVAHEIERRILDPYEDKKCKENGDVF